ncbi:hypothetical protein M2459_001343 [Parabacteroides sp. PF5-5]|uniref:hypothetical protein n=1 Tax=unclassified Parabacteroides TaxID=2649774 RepID=UPI002475A6F1|nr:MULTISPECIES: hypothetical protein [unclassified Parabacteroides]MDH6304608.1 hypothetical protein [Parabacteroides sp. PH5-39]MDH6315779.1 hypothetical protein [Parabacteroides sp. PF5-13]MDH6319438.1 hypothetical protein [Parabacteroides sp. PH5-13]MDH6323169.1 hypothetical protein [Parabacteroides sp. PH5-8]MDH6326971.1 hypothetical protein [Parabacteroides sp. PH5-41]
MSVVEEIVIKINDVQVESGKSIESFEQVANRFLDSVISFQNEVRNISKLANDLSDYIYEGFDNVDKDGYLQFRAKLQDVIKRLNASYLIFRKNETVYSSSKEVIREFKCSILDLTEIATDLEVSKIELENDEDFKSLAKQINDL